MFRSHQVARRLLGAAAAVAVLGLAACSDNQSDAAQNTSATVAPTTDAPTTTAAPATTATPTATAAPTSTDAPTTTEAEPQLVKVTAEEFAFDGVPTELSPGSYRFAFANAGSEPHELLIFRNPDGLTLEELAALGPVEGAKRVEIAAFLFAEPGQSAAQPADVELTPGAYEVACFIPTPTDSQPHFTHGMHTTITVG